MLSIGGFFSSLFRQQRSGSRSGFPCGQGIFRFLPRLLRLFSALHRCLGQFPFVAFWLRAAVFLTCLLPFCLLLPGCCSSSELWCFCFWHLYGVIGEAMSREGMFTLFVDNLPELVSLSWLKKMFNDYGVVKDAFIPEKRSKISGRKFGFVRYNCSISAEVATARANGL